MRFENGVAKDRSRRPGWRQGGVGDRLPYSAGSIQNIRSSAFLPLMNSTASKRFASRQGEEFVGRQGLGDPGCVLGVAVAHAYVGLT
jgi:hypothetical protein